VTHVRLTLQRQQFPVTPHVGRARGNIFTFFFLGVGILEAFPIIALVLGFYLFFVVANVPSLVGTLLKSTH